MLSHSGDKVVEISVFEKVRRHPHFLRVGVGERQFLHVDVIKRPRLLRFFNMEWFQFVASHLVDHKEKRHSLFDELEALLLVVRTIL